MAANEISERIAAAAWIRWELQPNGGELAIEYRSIVGFGEEIITTQDPSVPGQQFVILPLDREMARSETIIIAAPTTTVGSARQNYPTNDNIIATQGFLRAAIEPLAAPQWWPFQNSVGYPQNLPPDRFDTVGLLETFSDFGDVCVMVLEMPGFEGVTNWRRELGPLVAP
jgi:hypothetical protein